MPWPPSVEFRFAQSRSRFCDEDDRGWISRFGAAASKIAAGDPLSSRLSNSPRSSTHLKRQATVFAGPALTHGCIRIVSTARRSPSRPSFARVACAAWPAWRPHALPAQIRPHRAAVTLTARGSVPPGRWTPAPTAARVSSGPGSRHICARRPDPSDSVPRCRPAGAAGRRGLLGPRACRVVRVSRRVPRVAVLGPVTASPLRRAGASSRVLCAVPCVAPPEPRPASQARRSAGAHAGPAGLPRRSGTRRPGPGPAVRLRCTPGHPGRRPSRDLGPSRLGRRWSGPHVRRTCVRTLAAPAPACSPHLRPHARRTCGHRHTRDNPGHEQRGRCAAG